MEKNRNSGAKMEKEWTMNGLDNQVSLIKRYFRGRHILIWGAGNFGQEFALEIEKCGIVIYGFIDSYKCGQTVLEKYNVYSPSILNGRKLEYYIVVATSYYKSIEDQLNIYEYNSISDYLMLLGKYTVMYIGGFFCDQYANNIDCKSTDIKVSFCGKNSSVKVGKNCKIADNIEIFMKENAQLIIGDNVKIGKNVKIYITSSYLELNEGCEIGDDVEINCDDLSQCVFGEKTRIYHRCKINVYSGGNVVWKKKGVLGENSYLVVGGEVEIGENVSFAHNLELRATPKTYIKIGNECLFSYNVSMRTAIFDIQNEKSISHNNDVGIIIMDHVWIGMNVAILYNTVIGKDSVVGAMSLVKTRIPNGCMYAGNPAKLIRENIRWDISMVYN